jgi:DNA mismatch endonuclease (patch repair protein)
MKYKKKEIKILTPKFKESSGFYSTKKSSALMSKIRSRNTKAEVKLRKALWQAGFRYRLHHKEIVGKPDVVFVKYRIAVFVDGDFWHGYNWEEKKKKILSNKAYWIPKIESNIERDKQVNNFLTGKGWRVIRFWEHEIQKNIDECLAKIKAAFEAG